MEVNSVLTLDHQEFMTRIEDMVEQRATENEKASLIRFARQFFDRYPLTDIQQRPYQDVVGAMFDWWQRMSELPADEPRVVVMNPNFEEHGWLSSHTVVAAWMKDIPFMTDSIRMELNRRNIPIHFLRSNVFDVARDEHGVRRQIKCTQAPAEDLAEGWQWQQEAFVYFEINLHTDARERVNIRDSIYRILQDIQQVVVDYTPMTAKLKEAANQLRLSAGSNSAAKISESKAFLDWLLAGQFTFLGYAEFDLQSGNGDKKTLVETVESHLGVFKNWQHTSQPLALNDFNEGMARFHLSDEVLAFTKSGVRSRIHRSAYCDYVVVKRFNEQGEVIGEARFMGLYTANVYDNKVDSIPVVRNKVQEVIERTGLNPHTYEGKNLLRILETYPRDELIQINTEELQTIALGVAQINERAQVRLFLRKDPFGKFVNALVYVPKDGFSTRLRLKMQELIGREVNALECEFTTHFSESILARVHLVYRVDPHADVTVDAAILEQKIIELARGWDENLLNGLLEERGEEEGMRAYRRYKGAFSEAYRELYDARTAVKDVRNLDELSSGAPLAMRFYKPVDSAANEVRFKVFHSGSMLELSKVVPMLENLGLRVIGEHPCTIKPDGEATLWMHDFQLSVDREYKVDVSASSSVFQNAFAAVWQGETENDGFNRLVLGARLSWREVVILRAYARYMKQILVHFGQGYIANTLARYVDITRTLVALFKAKFDPRHGGKIEAEKIERLHQKVLDSLEQVDNLTQDRIIRRYLDLINGTLRTNYFQKDTAGQYKPYVSFKLAPRSIPDIPEPRPLYEIFVYSPRVEGVHLRGGKVARGGLRWSDRLQDYRTEVLGLVKAQQVKNAVIVPNGAKGGFVVKQPPSAGGREAFFAEGVSCYKTFIKGLLDVTDNLVEGNVQPPLDVIRHDDDDPYLVVAADKGTATFSDIANEISQEYGHWLGDAFASGGSQGYDHKGMGITARGAWVSVQRHFREKGINVQSDPFTVVGIGDMAGDVFGNGMLLSKTLQLCAAFNHLYIFVDPTPDAEKSFTERERLFANPRLNWGDYNAELISEGGGVFSRQAKRIDISPQMQKRFGIRESQLSPNELIHQLLQAPVDLIWNGGIGTYVKGSEESHADVGDKANDSVRINGNQLRCRVFGEGGNLGLTQLGRVEFGRNGGACNTDFIDNAAGVDCSDHEVNIKILIDGILAQGDLTQKQRNQLLAEMTDTVSEMVLSNNYQQTQAISVAHSNMQARFGEYRRLISQLEADGRLNRALEYIPDDETLLERHRTGEGLTRAELSVLISYVKVELKERFARDEIAQEPYLSRLIQEAFPERLCQTYPQAVSDHFLRKEIIATQLANDLVNNVGITFFHRITESAGATPVSLACAYIVSRDVFQLPQFRQEIESLDFSQPAAQQYDLLFGMTRRVRRATRWFLRNRRNALIPEKEVAAFQPALKELAGVLPTILTGSELRLWQERFEGAREFGLSEQSANMVAMPSSLFSGLGVVEAASVCGESLRDVAEIFFHMSERLSLNWFALQISDVTIDTYWQAMARESFLDDMEVQVRSLTVSLLKRCPAGLSFNEAFDLWCNAHSELYNRWMAMILELQASKTTDFAMFSVAMRELFDLAQASQFGDPLTP